MEYYEIDKATGFLTPMIENFPNGFSAKMKVTFLESFKKSANMTKSCNLVGVTRQMVQTHIEQDSAFGFAYRAAVDALCDEAEENLHKMTKRNPTACFGFLRAYRPHIWNDKKALEITGAPGDKLKGLLDDLKKEGRLLDVKDQKAK